MKFYKKIKPFHTDERGVMTYILPGEIPIIGALLITSKKGAVRANHYHKKDSHYSFMLKGSMEYYFKEAEKPKARRRKILVKEGDLVYTPPMEIHTMKFLEDSAFLALTTEKRDQKKYEKDLVRVELA